MGLLCPQIREVCINYFKPRPAGSASRTRIAGGNIYRPPPPPRYLPNQGWQRDARGGDRKLLPRTFWSAFFFVKVTGKVKCQGKKTASPKSPESHKPSLLNFRLTAHSAPDPQGRTLIWPSRAWGRYIRNAHLILRSCANSTYPQVQMEQFVCPTPSALLCFSYFRWRPHVDAVDPAELTVTRTPPFSPNENAPGGGGGCHTPRPLAPECDRASRRRSADSFRRSESSGVQVALFGPSR